MMPDEYQPTQSKTDPTAERSEKPGPEQTHLSPSDSERPTEDGTSGATADVDQLGQSVREGCQTDRPEEESPSFGHPEEAARQESSPSPDDAEQPTEEDVEESEAIPNVEETARQLDKYREQLQRLGADFDNYKKRTLKKHRELSDKGKRDLLDALLPVVDALDQALRADANDGVGYRRGVEAIHKQLLDVMFKRGVEPIEAVGADFDPTLHEAVSHEPSERHRNNEVIEEFRRGYKLDDGLLRASMVKVAKA